MAELQNILDQEPFRTIILKAIKSDDKLGYFRKMKTLEFPPTKKDNTWPEHKRITKQMVAQCFIINAAAKRPDICKRLQETAPTERKKLFDWGEEFGSYGSGAPVHLTPLIYGLPKDMFVDGYTAAGELELHDLFEKLMVNATDYPGWDEYLRSHRSDIKADGSIRKNPIPRFETRNN